MKSWDRLIQINTIKLLYTWSFNLRRAITFSDDCIYVQYYLRVHCPSVWMCAVYRRTFRFCLSICRSFTLACFLFHFRTTVFPTMPMCAGTRCILYIQFSTILLLDDYRRSTNEMFIHLISVDVSNRWLRSRDPCTNILKMPEIWV